MSVGDCCLGVDVFVEGCNKVSGCNSCYGDGCYGCRNWSSDVRWLIVRKLVVNWECRNWSGVKI